MAARFLDIGTSALPSGKPPAKTDGEAHVSLLSSESEKQNTAIEIMNQAHVSPPDPEHRTRRKAQAPIPSETMASQNGARRKSYGGSYDLP